jgi:hypothetical protein
MKNEYCFFCFCEETTQFDVGKAEICAIKAGAFHVTERYFSNGRHFLRVDNTKANFAG